MDCYVSHRFQLVPHREHSLRHNIMVYHKCTWVFMSSALYFCLILGKSEYFINFKLPFMRISHAGQTYGRKERQNETNSCFHYCFANVSTKKVITENGKKQKRMRMRNGIKLGR